MTPTDILIITHGSLARELYDTACSIMGPSENVHIYGIEREKSAGAIKEEIGSIMSNIIGSRKLLILTDMIGGTPTNIAIPYLHHEEVEVITGVNLPILITAIYKRRSTEVLSELAAIVSESGAKSIVNCREKMDI